MIRILSICGQYPRPKGNIAAGDEYTLQIVESRLLWIWSSTAEQPRVRLRCALRFALLTITAITEEPSQVLPAHAPGAQGFKLL